MVKHRRNAVFLFASLLSLAATDGALTQSEALVHFTAEKGLGLAGGVSAAASGASAAQIRFVPGRQGEGVYLPLDAALAVPVTAFNPAEGTLSFWFRPDWSPPSGQHSMIVEVDAGDGWRMSFRKGYSHVPDNCYLSIAARASWKGAKVAGGTSFGPHNLFTGRQWRHYAIRWSAVRGQVNVVVDGDSAARTGRFTCEQTERLAARVLLSGDARGAFDEVKVFDRWLDDAQLVETAGLTRVMAYLQEQTPPPGAGRSAGAGRPVTYVEPATGQIVTTTVADSGGVYDPDRMPHLPATPHTRWARPLAGGAIRVLILLPAELDDDRSALREGVELWQRLEMRCDIVSAPTEAVMKKEYDVIVVGHQGHQGILRSWWSDPKEYGTFMDATTRRWLCDRITSGKSGLVLVNPKWWGSEEAGKAAVGMTPARRADAGEILRGFPAPAMNRADPLPDDNIHHGGAYSHPGVYALADDFFATPESLASRVVQVYRDDKVRAAVLGYRISGDGIHALTPYSAGNSGATLVHYDYWMALAARAVLYAAGRVPASRIEGLEISPTRWTATVTGPAASLWYRARDIWGRENASGEVPVRGGQVALRGVPLPPRAVVDLILKDKGGAVLDWYSRAVPPAAGTRITGITLDREAYGKGDTLRGRATLQATAGGQYLLSVFLGDHEGRRLVRQQVPLRLAPGSAEAGFQMVIPPSSDSLLMRVEAVLTRGPEILDTRSADCPVPRTGFEGFFNGMCDRANNGAVDRMRRRLFRDEYGVNLMMHSGDGGYAVLPRDNLAHFEYTTHLGYPQSEETFKPWIEDWESFLPKNLRCDVQKLLPFRPLFYSLGEEHFLILGGSKHPLAVARFQQHLRRRYGSLEKLNEVWRSAFTSWEQVGMLPPAVIDVMTMDFGVQAFESRRFMEHLFADKHATLAEYFRRQDPHAKVGIHVGWDLWMGRSYDYWLLSRGMESMIGYGGVHNQYIRSFFRNYYGSWWHYDIGSHDNVRWHPWYMLMSGARGFMWYTMAPQIWGATTADLHPSSDWQAAAPEVKAAARMGDLLARTQYVQDQVAIHYSQDSMHAGMGPALSWTHNSFVNLLFDGGVPFHFLSYDQLAEGKARGVPLLILPGSISLSPGEVTAIRDHVRRGGVVWANTLPGTYDQFGRRLPASPLADLFAGLEERSLPGGGTARVSRDGRVVLGDIGNYLYDRNTGAHRPAQELLDAIVKLAGVQRVGRVLNAADGRPANGVWLSGYRRGGHRYLVACKDYQLVDQAPARVDLSFGPAAHVYDARSGRYLGRISSVRDTLQPTRGKVYSLLPYQVRGLGARAGRAARGQDLVVDVKMATSAPVGPDDLHVLRVSVISPGGKEVTALRRLASIRGGAGQVLLPLAHDDAPGRWTVRLQDTATCVASTVTVDMK